MTGISHGAVAREAEEGLNRKIWKQKSEEGTSTKKFLTTDEHR
jgi:hypothetical protein